MTLPAQIRRDRVIPVVRGLTAARARALAEALLQGGLSTIEVTMESPGSLEAMAALTDTETIVGAGTVTTIALAESAVNAGAKFLVSPHLSGDLVAWARSNDIPYLPGVFTPSEVAAAITMGVETVKLFPASVGGPGLIGALRGPFPDVSFIPTGGVTGDNAASYLAQGAIAVGVGGWLTDHDDLTVVTERASALTEVV